MWEWSSWSLAAIGEGDYDSWAEEVLDDDSWASWNDADLTLDECTDLLGRWQEASGESVGLAVSLTSFLEEHCESVESDLRRWCSVRLTDLYRGDLSYRELMVLITKLPQESRAQTALRDNPREEFAPPAESDLKFGPWTHGDFLAVEILDAIRHLEVTVARANGGKDIEYPKPTQRPGMKRLAREISDSAEAVAARRYLDEFNKGLRATE